MRAAATAGSHAGGGCGDARAGAGASGERRRTECDDANHATGGRNDPAGRGDDSGGHTRAIHTPRGAGRSRRRNGRNEHGTAGASAARAAHDARWLDRRGQGWHARQNARPRRGRRHGRRRRADADDRWHVRLGSARRPPCAVALRADPGASALAGKLDRGCARVLYRKLPDPAVPVADLSGGGHGLRNPLAGAGGDQRGRDGLRAGSERVQRRRGGMDAVPALDLGPVRRRRQWRRLQGPLQPGRRDLRRRQVPASRRRGYERQGGRVLLQPLPGIRRLGAAARAIARRHAAGTARGDHRPDRGAVPSACALALQRWLRDDSRPRIEPGEDARRHDDLLAGGGARDRGAGRRSRADRRLVLARTIRVAARRLWQHVRVRAARQRVRGVSGAGAA